MKPFFPKLSWQGLTSPPPALFGQCPNRGGSLFLKIWSPDDATALATFGLPH